MVPTTRRRPERSEVAPSWLFGALMAVRHSSGPWKSSGLFDALLASKCHSGYSASSSRLIDLLATQRSLGHSASSRLPRTSWPAMQGWSRIRTTRDETFFPEPPRYFNRIRNASLGRGSSPEPCENSQNPSIWSLGQSWAIFQESELKSGR